MLVAEETALQFQSLLAQAAEFFDPGDPPQVCRDASDDYLLGLCVAGGADYLVTRDEDLLVLGRFGATEIVYPARLLELIQQAPPQ